MTPGDLEIVIEAGQRTADYIVENDIGLLAIVDTAARPMYIPIMRALEEIEDATKPNVIFLNPYFFYDPIIHGDNAYFRREANHHVRSNGMSIEEVDDLVKNEEEIQRLRDLAAATRAEDVENSPTKDNAIALFEHLINQAGFRKPINHNLLIFDICIHKGYASTALALVFDKIGIFDNIHMGVIDNSNNQSQIKPELVTHEFDEDGFLCKPFGTNAGTNNGLDCLATTPTDDPQQAREAREYRQHFNALSKIVIAESKVSG